MTAMSCIRPSHAIAGRASSGHRTTWATKLDTVQTCTFRAIAVKEQLPLKRFQWAPRSPKDPDSCQPHFKSAIPCIKPCKCNMVPKLHQMQLRCIIIQPNAGFIFRHMGISKPLSKPLMAEEGVLRLVKSHSNVTGDDCSVGYPDCMVDGWRKYKAPVQPKQKHH